MRRCALCAFALVWVGLSAVAQQPRVLAPHRPIPPKVEKAVKGLDSSMARSLVGGLWMTDTNVKASIYIRNTVETDVISVTPVLYLSNGASYTLPDVRVGAADIAIIDINSELQKQGVVGWATLSGYVELRYSWPWDPFCATIRNLDTAHSLILNYGLQSTLPAPLETRRTSSATSMSAIEGMWWKQESDVNGFVAVANLSSQPAQATIEVTDADNNLVAAHTATVSPHGMKLVDLPELRTTSSTQGGIRVTSPLATDKLVVNGGLEDQAVGYSATIPFVRAPDATADAVQASMSELGLMTGPADPMMLFPAGTTFTPYSVLRNVSTDPITVSPTLWWMQGSAPQSASLPAIKLLPYQTYSLDAKAGLAQLGSKDFNGSFNLVLDSTAKPGSLLMAAGSVDQTNTYVFEVTPRGIGESGAKSIQYWNTANGDDTMVTLWNPADEAQDLILTLFFSGGHYALPLHLEPRVTRMFNVSDIIHTQLPDAEGNIIPASAQAGSAKLSGSKAENEHILAAFEVGTYNVRKATCMPSCGQCYGYTGAHVVDSPFAVKVNDTKQLTLIGTYGSGTQYNLTSGATWSSNNAPVATVQTGVVTGKSAGNATISALALNLELQVYMCGQNGYQCPRGNIGGPDPGTIYQCGISVKFTGSKSTGDALSFLTGSETLGLKNLSDSWRWQVEVTGTVSPTDASQWILKQSFTGRQKQILKTPSGTLLSQTDTNLSAPVDDPDGRFRQQPPGSFTYFWLDGPGQYKTLGANTIDSETQVQNFISSVVSVPDGGGFVTSCITQWHLKLVVKPGGVLDTVNSSAGTGFISTSF